MDRNNVVGIASGYLVDGPGIEYRWGFLHPSRPALGPNGYQVYFPRVKPSTLSAEVKERVELHLWAFMVCARVNFTFYFLCLLAPGMPF